MKIGLRHYLTLAFTIVATVPVLILGLWVEETSLKKEVQAVTEKHLLLATNTTAALDRYARDAKGVFGLFVENVQQPVSQASLELARQIGFRYVRVLEADGRLVGQMHIDTTAPHPLPEQVFQQLYPSSEMTVNFSPVMRDARNQPTLYLSKRLTAGRIAIAALDLDYIRQMQSAISFGRKGHSAIVDHKGNVLAHPLKEWEQQARSLSVAKPVELMMSGKSGVTRFHSPAIDKDMITGYAPVPETGWGVMVPQPLEELEERASDVKQMVLGLVLIGLVAAAIVSWALAGLMVRPLEAVIVAAQRISKGYLDTRVQAIPEGYLSEYRNLGNSFNTMIHDVAKGIVEREDAERELQITHDQLGLVTRRLKNLNTELESRVEEGTSDLRLAATRSAELASALQLSNLRLKDFAESASDWFWEMDENLRWSYFSEKFSAITGISPETLLGKTYAESGVYCDDDHLHTAHLRDLAAARPFRNFEHYLIGADGEAVYFSISANPVFDATGRFAGYRGSGTNVTERHRLDRNKSEFITTVSHELRTPLTSIHGSMGLLVSGVIDPQTDEARNLLEIARKNSERLLKIVDDVLDVERLEHGVLSFDFQALDLSKLVVDTIDDHAQAARQQGVELHLRDRADDVRVKGDPRRLKRALGNLISNALKFSRDGQGIEVSLRCPENTARISVTDHGPGIGEAYQDHMFEPYALVEATDDRQNGGIGLGLCIAKSIVEQHDGRIGFHTEQGVGSIFYIELPRLQA